ncbi:hypothetical protein [Streptomyces sp. NPDC000851]
MVTKGDGPVNQMADVQERMTLQVAGGLVKQANRVARDRESAPGEMRRLLLLLAAATKDAIEVAKMRGERLGLDGDEDS